MDYVKTAVNNGVTYVEKIDTAISRVSISKIAAVGRKKLCSMSSKQKGFSERTSANHNPWPQNL